jgi:uncharacterized membrane protein
MMTVERSFAAPATVRVDAGRVEAIDRLAAIAAPGDVLLEPEVHDPVAPAVVPVRPIVGWPQWIRHALGKEEVMARIDDVRRFFAATDADDMRRTLGRYGVRWVWVPAPATVDPSSRLPELSLAFANGAGRLYRVTEGYEP